MPTIERRLEALETAQGNAVAFMLILRQVMVPGVPAGEAAFAEVMGQRFKREPAESEDQFLTRVRAWAEANSRPGQRTVLVAASEEDLAL